MGKGGDSSHVPEKKEVLVNGRFYDVSSLKHPGGNVINYYAGKNIDATQAFENFHIRSKKAKKYLDNLPSRPADEDAKKIRSQLPNQESLLRDFDQMTQDFVNEGLFKPSIPHIVYRLSEILLLYGAGFYFLLSGVNALSIIGGLFLLAVAQGRCGWLMHECGHYSLTGDDIYSSYLSIYYYYYYYCYYFYCYYYYYCCCCRCRKHLHRPCLASGALWCGLWHERQLVEKPTQQTSLYATEDWT
jgi:hypothetical protein